MRKTRLPAVCFLCLSVSLGALTLDEVNYNDLGETADASSIAVNIQAGIDLFLRDHAQLAGENSAWLDTAVLSAGGSHSREEKIDSYYLRLDLAWGDDEESFAFRTNPATLEPKDFAQALRNLTWTISGFQPAKTEAPVLVRRFGISAFIADISYGGMLPVTGIASLSDGRLVLGHSMYSTIVDPMLRVVDTIGKELSKSAKYTGYNLRASRAGTILANMSGSGDVQIFNLPEQKPRTVATGVSSIESYAWLADGTLIVKEMMTPHFVVVEQKKRRSLVLADFQAKYESGSLTAGPDSTLIAMNPAKRFISWYDKNGNLLNRLIPCLSENQFGTVRAVSWLPNGNYMITATGFVCMTDQEGEILWFLPLESSLGTMIYEAVWSESDQSVYLFVPGGKTVYQYMDAASFRSLPTPGADGTKPDWRFLQTLDAELAEDPEDMSALKRLADYYLASKADDYALSLYQAYSQFDSGNREVEKTIARLKADQLIAAAEAFEARVRQTIRDIGPESAKADYSQAMGSYEQALALKPGDQKILQARAALARLMKDEEAGINAPVPPLTIENNDFPPIFPALLATYAANPVGTVTVRNATGRPVTNVRATFFIPRFMDFPGAAPELPSLANGEESVIRLYAPFNQEILGIEEDLPVQTRVRIEWTVDGTPYSLEQNPSTLIYRRTALTWDDSGKLASFITPNEETVNAFAMIFLESMGKNDLGSTAPTSAQLSPRIQRAAAILSGLSAMKIRYLEDPQSPLSTVMGKAVAVDTVRFPRTTLLYRSGDCDDTTALLASLLEAAGIPTAILTTPGHVFLAFNSGIKETKGWMLEPSGDALPYRGDMWIPLESTILDRGFEGSWAAAAKLTKQWKSSKSFEFLPLADLRAKYPPIPLPRTGIPLEKPALELLASSFRSLHQRLGAQLYNALVLLYSVPLQTKTEETARLNRLGIVHGIFANQKEAFASFTSALAVNPDFHPAMLNLANLYFLTGENEKARQYLSRVDVLNPGSAASASLGEKIRSTQKGDTGKSQTLLVDNSLNNSNLSVENRGTDAAANTDWTE